MRRVVIRGKWNSLFLFFFCLICGETLQRRIKNDRNVLLRHGNDHLTFPKIRVQGASKTL